MRLFHTLVASLAVSAVVLTATPGVAQDKEAIIKERKALMKQQGGDLKAIGAYVKGQGDQATALEKATDLLALSEKIVPLFPAGTSLADFPDKTDAKPELWGDRAKFESYPVELRTEVQDLLEAIKASDVAAVGQKLGIVGKNGCSKCHTDFRQDRP